MRRLDLQNGFGETRLSLRDVAPSLAAPEPCPELRLPLRSQWQLLLNRWVLTPEPSTWGWFPALSLRPVPLWGLASTAGAHPHSCSCVLQQFYRQNHRHFTF